MNQTVITAPRLLLFCLELTFTHSNTASLLVSFMTLPCVQNNLKHFRVLTTLAAGSGLLLERNILIAVYICFFSNPHLKSTHSIYQPVKGSLWCKLEMCLQA